MGVYVNCEIYVLEFLLERNKSNMFMLKCYVRTISHLQRDNFFFLTLNICQVLSIFGCYNLLNF